MIPQHVKDRPLGAPKAARLAAACAVAALAWACRVPSQSGGELWGADYFPNVSLTTHEGKSVKFFDDLIKDKVVVVNFIYTTCPDTCPLETARLLEVQAILGDRVGRDVFMYSITIDPDRDTPEVLKAYAEAYRVQPGWTFLTGSADDITLLRRKLGVYIEDIQGEDSNDHNVSMVIGNQATGRWMQRSPFENPYVLATQIGDWLHNWKLPREGDREFDNAPKLRSISDGESLFRTRCAACHSIGRPEDGIARSGPDLLGVTKRREHAWLSRWLAEPDKMLAEKDPIAMELYGAYNGIPMPNLRLSEDDVDQLIDYLATESRRVAATQTAAAVRSELPDEPAPCCEKARVAVVAADPKPAKPGAQRAQVLSLASWGSIGLGVILGLFVLISRRRH